MTKKDCVRFADALAMVRDDQPFDKATVVKLIAQVFKCDNYAFSPDRFIEACKYKG